MELEYHEKLKFSNSSTQKVINLFVFLKQWLINIYFDKECYGEQWRKLDEGHSRAIQKFWILRGTE